MRSSNLQFQGYWDLVLSIDFTYQYCGVFGVSVLRTPYTWTSKDSRNANQNTYVCILHKLVRTYTLNYPRDLFLSIRQREKVADWGCGYNLVLDFVFGACRHSLSRLYLPICVSHQPYDMIVGDNHVNMIYCRCYCNTNICILFHPYRDTGGVNCISCLLPTSESQSNARNWTYSATMQPSVLPPLDICGDFGQGRRRSPASSSYGVIPIILCRWSFSPDWMWTRSASY